MSPRPPRGEWTGRGRASRKAAEKAWEHEFAIAERRGMLRLAERIRSLAEEHSTVIDGVEYVEWSAVLMALDDELSRLPAPTPPRGTPDEEGPAPTATGA
jgi:hypothetical protein